MDVSAASHHEAVSVLKNAGQTIALTVLREREDKTTVVKSSRENLVKDALEEAFEISFQEDNAAEVQSAPEPQVSLNHFSLEFLGRLRKIFSGGFLRIL